MSKKSEHGKYDVLDIDDKQMREIIKLRSQKAELLGVLRGIKLVIQFEKLDNSWSSVISDINDAISNSEV